MTPEDRPQEINVRLKKSALVSHRVQVALQQIAHELGMKLETSAADQRAVFNGAVHALLAFQASAVSSAVGAQHPQIPVETENGPVAVSTISFASAIHWSPKMIDAFVAENLDDAEIAAAYADIVTRNAMSMARATTLSIH